MEPDKIYITPGSIVRVRHNIENRPNMWAVEKITKTLRNSNTGEQENLFMGIKCRWFDKMGCLQEAILSTKDLEIIS